MERKIEDMEEKKIKLTQEDIDYIRSKFKEITQDYIIQGCDKEKDQYEFGKLFEVEQDANNKLSNLENTGKKLKPFDIDLAKAGKPVCTRDGRKARIICFDVKDDRFPLVAVIKDDKGIECVLSYTNKGNFYYAGAKDNNDLMMLPEKKEGWVNIFNHDNNVSWAENEIYPSEERAKNAALKIDGNMLKYIATVKIEWVE